MQMRRNQPFALDADPVETIRWRTRKTVGADMHLAIDRETQRQMLASQKHRQTGTIGWLQIDRADAAAFCLNLRHAQRPPLVAQCLRLQSRIRLGPIAGQQAGR